MVSLLRAINDHLTTWEPPVPPGENLVIVLRMLATILNKREHPQQPFLISANQHQELHWEAKGLPSRILPSNLKGRCPFRAQTKHCQPWSQGPIRQGWWPIDSNKPIGSLVDALPDGNVQPNPNKSHQTRQWCRSTRNGGNAALQALHLPGTWEYSRGKALPKDPVTRKPTAQHWPARLPASLKQIYPYETSLGPSPGTGIDLHLSSSSYRKTL